MCPAGPAKVRNPFFVKAMIRTAVITLTCCRLLLCSALDDPTDLQLSREQLSNLQKDNAEIKRALKLITDKLTGNGLVSESVNLQVDVRGLPVLGSESARFAIVEFSDYQCEFCGEYFSRTFRSVVGKYVDTGHFRYFVQGFPLPAHARARPAAAAAVCAQAAGKFWEVHEALFSNQQNLEDADLRKYATAAGMDPLAFERCVQQLPIDAEITKGVQAAKKLGVQGTPTFLIGYWDPKNSMAVGAMLRVVGARSFEDFDSVLLDLLKTRPGAAVGLGQQQAKPDISP